MITIRKKGLGVEKYTLKSGKELIAYVEQYPQKDGWHRWSALYVAEGSIHYSRWYETKGEVFGYILETFYGADGA